MKKLILVLAIVIAIFSLAACDNFSGSTSEREDVITVEDGYLVVNGVKTEYKVDTEDVITVEDGYLVVNGVKTEYKVDTEDVITVEDGYLVVNGVKTEHKVDAEDVITVEDGYLVVNGVKTEYKVSECEHIWETVTTAPTCTAGGYDTNTCELCGKSVQVNETEPIDHTYGENYVIDEDYHWFKCTECDAVKDKEFHTLGDDGVCTVCQLPISATPGVIYDKSTDGTYAEVIGYEGTAAKVKIADEYDGLPVKNIYNSAFKDNKTITSVVIPDSVTSIGEFAFFDCRSLTSVVIGDSVTSIGASAFCYCYSLTSVVIPNSVTSIGASAFCYCYSLTSVVIPNSVTSIGASAFYDCSPLKFNEYDNCKYLGSEDNPYFALIEASNTNMSSYEIHNDTRILANYTFSGYSRLTSIVIPDSVTSIGGYAFFGCSALTSVVIGDSVTSIGDEAFRNCSSLTSVVIGDSVTDIGYQVFHDCDSLTSVVIPDSVTSIGDDAFLSCSSLTNVYYTGTEEEWATITIGSGNSALKNATIHYNYVPEE